jgi:membrane associated rhomboid family serine protease
MVGVLGLLTLLSSISPGSSNVAHLTHLGGLVFGYLFVRFPSVFNMIPIPRFSRTRRGGSSRWKDL